MSDGISTVLGFAVGVAISPVPIIAVILMLFSHRARINGPLFMVGWMVALAPVSGLAYSAAVAGNASTSTSTDSAIAWGKILVGVLFLLMAVRTWRKRPAPGAETPMPNWMAGIDDLKPGKALAFGLLLAGGLAGRAQRRRDGRAVPGIRRRPDQQGPGRLNRLAPALTRASGRRSGSRWRTPSAPRPARGRRSGPCASAPGPTGTRRRARRRTAPSGSCSCPSAG